MKTGICLMFLCCLSCLNTQAQVTIDEPNGMKGVIAEYRSLFPPEEEITGWSIMVTLNRDRREIDNAMRNFKYRFPQYRDDVEWIYDNPYYKLVFGFFKDRQSAQPLLDKIRRRYEGAFEVKSTKKREEIIKFRRQIDL